MQPGLFFQSVKDGVMAVLPTNVTGSFVQDQLRPRFGGLVQNQDLGTGPGVFFVVEKCSPALDGHWLWHLPQWKSGITRPIEKEMEMCLTQIKC